MAHSDWCSESVVLGPSRCLVSCLVEEQPEDVHVGTMSIVLKIDQSADRVRFKLQVHTSNVALGLVPNDADMVEKNLAIPSTSWTVPETDAL